MQTICASFTVFRINKTQPFLDTARIKCPIMSLWLTKPSINRYGILIQNIPPVKSTLLGKRSSWHHTGLYKETQRGLLDNPSKTGPIFCATNAGTYKKNSTSCWFYSFYHKSLSVLNTGWFTSTRGTGNSHMGFCVSHLYFINFRSCLERHCS